MPEIRRLLWRLELAVQHTVAHILAWSHWRRWQHTVAQLCHYKRRGAWFTQLPL